MFQMPLNDIILTAAISGIIGYGIVFFYSMHARRKRRKISQFQHHQILKSAQKQAEHVASAELNQTSHQALEEELSDEIEDKNESLKNAEEDLALRQQFIDEEEKRLTIVEHEIQIISSKVQSLSAKFTALQEQSQKIKSDMQSRLESKADINASNLKNQLTDQQILNRQLNCQKHLKDLLGRLDGDSKRMANRILSRCLSRYSPNFYWPKMINHVELEKSQLELFSGEENQLLKDLKELAGIEIEFQPTENPKIPDMLKLGGGMGLKREAARLTLQDFLKKPNSAWANVAVEYRKQEDKLNQQALELGRKAVINLKLEKIHPEIQRMVGFLNWRTSYRQNQYLHTFEVAKFAGIIASELGVSPDHAKRCGLMHDIGKSIDYRIEGGHAVISGDYADRYGESQLICDTVMSHHDELVIETPLAWVLKTADTLSGARPGARVNLEEGYQMRLSGINDAIRSFGGIMKVEIMNGAREVHVEVDHTRISDEQLNELCAKIAQKIEADVAFPGQIKILISRKFEATATA